QAEPRTPRADILGAMKAAGIEPASRVLRERWRATSVARARFSAESAAPPNPLESPTVPWSPHSLGDILETADRIAKVAGVASRIPTRWHVRVGALLGSGWSTPLARRPWR